MTESRRAWLDFPLDPATDGAFGNVEILAGLQVDPELRRRAEVAPEPGEDGPAVLRLEGDLGTIIEWAASKGKKKKPTPLRRECRSRWLRGRDLNPRPLGYAYHYSFRCLVIQFVVWTFSSSSDRLRRR